MNNQTTNREHTVSRRELLLGAAAAASATIIASKHSTAHAADQNMGRPNSEFEGVQIGAITYSFRSMPSTAADILTYCRQCNLSSIELMGDPAEQFAGCPTGGRRDKNAQKAKTQWRLSASMDKYHALRKLYNDAGVKIHIVKFGSIGNGNMSNEEIDYYFNVAKALGAKGITREISEEAAQRLGPIADKHRIMIGFHNHMQITPTTYDGSILSYGRYLGINLDVGHFVAGTNESPIPLIEKYQDRILSLHIKDRKVKKGPNMPFGQGDTPVALILQLIKRNKWTFPADIELEYKIPSGSNAVDEVAKCVQFCKESLV